MENEMVVRESAPLLDPGTRFGRLTIIRFDHVNKHRSRCYLCLCDCGVEKIINRSDLKSGHVLSCGCLQKERIVAAVSGKCSVHYIHGGTGTKLYGVWRAILGRCEYPKHISYKWYGAKGVGVCEEWRTFEVFREWATKSGYRDGLSIDRKNPKEGYLPDNCEWMTRSENTAKSNRERGK